MAQRHEVGRGDRRSLAPFGLSPLDPAAALFPLRLFLGGTFVYAGIQKLSDPGFLHPGAPTYIGTQLHGFAHGTPGGFLLRTFAIPFPKLAGVGVALLEIAVGLLVLAGLLTRLAAAVGLGLNLVLFLTNSWHTSPYFLGSDIVFVFAWLPFVLTGASGQPALDNALDRWTEGGAPWSSARSSLASRWEADVARTRGESLTRRVPVASGPALTRRGVLAQALGLAGFATLAIGGLSALAKGSYRGTRARWAAAPCRCPRAARRRPRRTLRSPPSTRPRSPISRRVRSSSARPAAFRQVRPRPTPTPPAASRAS